MLGEALVGKIADMAVSAFWGKVAQRSPKLLKVKLTEAMKVALIVALAKTFEQYPEQDEDLFLENFLHHEGAPIIAKVLTPDALPTGKALAQAWASRYDENERDPLAIQITPLCDTFLGELYLALSRTRLLQEDPLVRDLLALDATNALLSATATLSDQVEGIEANTRATQQELVAFREDIQHASEHIEKVFAAWLDTGAVLNRLLEAQLHGVKHFNYTYASRVRRFLREYLGNGSDALDADERVPFGGRDSVLDDLTTWLDTGRQKYLLMVAKAGRGKSATLARWLNFLQQRATETPIFVPISIRFETAAASIFMAILASRLAELHGETLPDTPSDAEKWKNLCHLYLTRPIPNRQPVVLIIDGLDEAEQGIATASLLPHPDELAPTVRIVLSARLQLGDASPHNWITRLGLPPRQVKAFTLPRLDREGLEDVLVKWGNPLHDLPYDHADLVKELLRITEGDPLLVNLYVKELLELGQGVTRLTPAQLGKTPKGLGGFFQLWQDSIEQSWSGEGDQRLLSQTFLAVRSLLAGARGPIYLDELAELTSLETGGVADVLRHAMIPLKRFLVGDGKTEGFVFSHPRFADYVWEVQLSATERDIWSRRFVNHGAKVIHDLRANPPQKHPSNAERFRYAVQYYREHLDRIDAPVESYYTLLCQEWSEAWFALRGTYDGFLVDIERIWAKAWEDIESGDRLQGMTKVILCALCQSSIVTLSSNIEPDLLAMGLESNIYSPTQAWVIIRQMATERQKVVALQKLIIFHDLSDTLRQEIQEFCYTIQDHHSRTAALRDIAQLYEGDERTTLLREALRSARSIQNDSYRVTSLRDIARVYEEEKGYILLEALILARSIQNDYSRTIALGAIAQEHEGEERRTLLQEALAVARSIQNDSYRAHALQVIAQVQEDPERTLLLEEALRVARSIQGAFSRANVLRDIAQLHEGEKRSILLQETLTVARSIQPTTYRATALRNIALVYKGEERNHLLQESLKVARSIQNDYSRAVALRDTAPLLPVEEALTVARSIQDASARTATLVAIAQMHEGKERIPLLREALASARSVQDDFYRSTSLATIAQGFDAADRTRLLEEALTVARSIQIASLHATVLRNIAQLHEGKERTALLAEALAVARSIQNDSDRASAFRRLAPLLSLEEGLTVARSIQDDLLRVATLQEIAQMLESKERSTLLQEILVIAYSIQNDYSRAVALRDTAPLLPVEEALTVARSIQDASARAATLVAIAQMHEGKERIPLLREALTSVRSVLNDLSGVSVARNIAQMLEGEERNALLEEVLAIARSIQNDSNRATALGDIAWAHEGEERRTLLQEAMSVVRSIQNNSSRTVALRNLAPLLPLEEALAVARSIQNDSARAAVLHDITLLHNSFTYSYQSYIKTLREWYNTIRSSATHSRPSFLQDLTSLIPLTFILANAHSSNLSPSPISITPKSLDFLRTAMLYTLDFSIVLKRRQFLEDAKLQHLEPYLHMEATQRDFVYGLLETVQSTPAENGVSALAKLLRQLAVEWEGDQERHKFVGELLEIPTVQKKPSERLAREIAKSLQDVCAWWP